MTLRTFNTGEVLYDLPSPYIPHPVFGLLHLPRFLAKIRKHLQGGLPSSYQRNFTRGFDGFLCLHLGIDPKAVIEAVASSGDDETLLHDKLRALFPQDLRVAAWNRKLVQMGLHGPSRDKLQEIKAQMGLADRHDIVSFADIIEVDEGRID
jgi:hypothetical protein